MFIRKRYLIVGALALCGLVAAEVRGMLKIDDTTNLSKNQDDVNSYKKMLADYTTWNNYLTDIEGDITLDDQYKKTIPTMLTPAKKLIEAKSNTLKILTDANTPLLNLITELITRFENILNPQAEDDFIIIDKGDTISKAAAAWMNAPKELVTANTTLTDIETFFADNKFIVNNAKGYLTDMLGGLVADKDGFITECSPKQKADALKAIKDQFKNLLTFNKQLAWAKKKFATKNADLIRDLNVRGLNVTQKFAGLVPTTEIDPKNYPKLTEFIKRTLEPLEKAPIVTLPLDPNKNKDDLLKINMFFDNALQAQATFMNDLLPLYKQTVVLKGSTLMENPYTGVKDRIDAQLRRAMLLNLEITGNLSLGDIQTLFKDVEMYYASISTRAKTAVNNTNVDIATLDQLTTDIGIQLKRIESYKKNPVFNNINADANAKPNSAESILYSLNTLETNLTTALNTINTKHVAIQNEIEKITIPCVTLIKEHTNLLAGFIKTVEDWEKGVTKKPTQQDVTDFTKKINPNIDILDKKLTELDNVLLKSPLGWAGSIKGKATEIFLLIENSKTNAGYKNLIARASKAAGIKVQVKGPTTRAAGKQSIKTTQKSSAGIVAKAKAGGTPTKQKR